MGHERLRRVFKFSSLTAPRERGRGSFDEVLKSSCPPFVHVGRVKG
jgi:hypothetical protein